MDNVFNYKDDLCKKILSFDDEKKVVLEFEDLLYIFVSNNANYNSQLVNNFTKIARLFKNGKATANAGSLKKLINLTSKLSLEENINAEIYNLLLIDQVIKSNNILLKEEFDSNLNNMNNNLINSYNTEIKNFINNLY